MAEERTFCKPGEKQIPWLSVTQETQKVNISDRITIANVRHPAKNISKHLADVHAGFNHPFDSVRKPSEKNNNNPLLLAMWALAQGGGQGDLH